MMASFDKKPFFIFIPIFAVAVLAILFTIRLSDSSKSLGNGLSLAKNPLPIPTIVSVQAKTDTTEVHSADGKMKLSMTSAGTPGGQTVYTFSVSDISGAGKKTVYMKILEKNQSMQVPANSWSPDNKYLFLQENDNGNLSFFVFKASGEPFSDGKNYIDVVPLFTQKKTGDSLSDVTGWDSDTLLHVFTVSDQGRGPSYWFDVESGNFLVLATR